MIEKSDFIAQLTTKLAEKDQQAKVDVKIQAIVSGIEYELDKFREYSASFLLSLNPQFTSLYNFSSYKDFEDQKLGIRGVMQKVIYIRDKYDVDLTNDVRKYIYARLNNLKDEYFEKLAPEHSATLKKIIQNREVWPQTKIIQEMESILKDLLSSERAELRQLVKLMLQVDPLFQGWRNSEQYHTFFPPRGHAHHAAEEDSLNLDFFKPVINFVTNIYKKFTDKQEITVEEDNKRFDNKLK